MNLNNYNNNAFQALYIWLGGGNELRSKTRTLYSMNIPEWNYDGSSTNQASGNDSEVKLLPVSIFKDPFRKGKNILVWCETRNPKDNSPISTNTRYHCNKIMEKVKQEIPWFGLEQEYTLYKDEKTLLGWYNNKPIKQGRYYCSVGYKNAFGRKIVEEHYKACLFAGIKIAGSNAEVMPGQWEYQIGPCVGIEAGDHLWVSRYILHRVCEDFNIIASFKPKPLKDWNGAGCHVNYSTYRMRNHGGHKEIKNAIDKLSEKHKEHIEAYGNNIERLTGKHETSSINEFTSGVADRSASIRIPYSTVINKCGYFEDRRPASDCDPYLVTGIIVKTTLVD